MLIGLGDRQEPRNPIDKVFDAVMGLSPEDSAALDVDQYGGEDEGDGSEWEDVKADGDLADEDLDSDEEDYTIVVDVPYNNATRELKLPCNTSFSGFLTALLKKMEVSVTHPSAIGYIPSYEPRNPKPVPKLLETAEDYESMMEDIEAYRANCLKRKGGTVKKFSIALSNTSNTPTDGRKEHVGKACYVTRTGEHYQYNNNDLVIWATLVRRNLASVEEVPDQLKIEDKFNKQKKAKNAIMQTQSNGFNFNGSDADAPYALDVWHAAALDDTEPFPSSGSDFGSYAKPSSQAQISANHGLAAGA
ncbi:hypothetical protein B0H13DRAFT_1858750 [Mycena leptocephala]|nr:hypothetical protein B0H13DRAFT_1858750 [Mycena leptocephala]